MLSSEKRCQYLNNQLADVICQLRYPEILSINTTIPDQFQEQIRDEYPLYSSRKEAPVPKIKGGPNGLSIDKPAETINYQFTSADGHWRVNLTSSFISLACNKYTCWEDFAAHLDKPLAAFIKLYKPAFFERVGLRYINLFARKNMGIEHIPYSELFTPCYLGVLAEDDVRENGVIRSNLNAEFAIGGGCHVKINAGPAVVKRPNGNESTPCFAFDQDLYMKGNVPVNMSAGALQTLHGQAFPIFRGAITDRMHELLEPTDILE